MVKVVNLHFFDRMVEEGGLLKTYSVTNQITVQSSSRNCFLSLQVHTKNNDICPVVIQTLLHLQTVSAEIKSHAVEIPFKQSIAGYSTKDFVYLFGYPRVNTRL
jgi:hypothetical protein